jgi:hypothetical protein
MTPPYCGSSAASRHSRRVEQRSNTVSQPAAMPANWSGRFRACFPHGMLLTWGGGHDFGGYEGGVGCGVLNALLQELA